MRRGIYRSERRDTKFGASRASPLAPLSKRSTRVSRINNSACGRGPGGVGEHAANAVSTASQREPIGSMFHVKHEQYVSDEGAHPVCTCLVVPLRRSGCRGGGRAHPRHPWDSHDRAGVSHSPTATSKRCGRRIGKYACAPQGEGLTTEAPPAGIERCLDHENATQGGPALECGGLDEIGNPTKAPHICQTSSTTDRAPAV